MVWKIQWEYEARDEHMARYLSGMESCLAKLSGWWVKRIPREENGKAYALAGVVVVLPITEYIMLLVYVQTMPYMASKRVHDVAYAGEGWMHPIANYLHTGEFLKDGKQAYKLCIQVVWFTLTNDQ